MAKLTDKQQRFVEEYLIDLNATQAAIRAGYSARTAEVQGPRLLGNVRVARAVSEEIKARRERMKLTQDSALREIANLATYDPRGVIEWGPQGFKIKDSAELTEDQAKLVHSVSESPSQWGWRRTIKFYDRLRALELYGRHLGLFTDRVEHTGSGGGPIKVIRIERAERTDRRAHSKESARDA